MSLESLLGKPVEVVNANSGNIVVAQGLVCARPVNGDASSITLKLSQNRLMVIGIILYGKENGADCIYHFDQGKLDNIVPLNEKETVFAVNAGVEPTYTVIEGKDAEVYEMLSKYLSDAKINKP